MRNIGLEEDIEYFLSYGNYRMAALLMESAVREQRGEIIQIRRNPETKSEFP